MPPSIGVNMRVTGHCSQGGRKHMEDMFSVAYQQTEDEKGLEYAFIGIFDGHGGREAALFAKDHLMDYIVNQKGFWSENDEDVLRAIKDGYLQTHYAMWANIEKWSRTASGFPSTAGTTASVAFIRKGKIYLGHVGDSQIILGYQKEGCVGWDGIPLTREHKPESLEESTRIEKSGGKVLVKQGVPRVVWNRPRPGHKGPVRRSTPIDEIPFLAVARSLGDLWSYNSELDEFVVSPEPDVDVITIEVGVHKCLIFGTDGLWNVMSPKLAATLVFNAEQHNEQHVLLEHSETQNHQHWINPSKNLVDSAMGFWDATRLRADNTSAVTLMLDPQGPPRAQVLRDKKDWSSVVKTSGSNGCVAVFTRYAQQAQPVAAPVYPTVPTPMPRIPDNIQINEVSSSVEPSVQVGSHSAVTSRVVTNVKITSSTIQTDKLRSTVKFLKTDSIKKLHTTTTTTKHCIKNADEDNSSDAENCNSTGPDLEPTMGTRKSIAPKKTCSEKRTLRSSTAAASPARTLRSRNTTTDGAPSAVPSGKRPHSLSKRVRPATVIPIKRVRQSSLVLSSRLRKRGIK